MTPVVTVIVPIFNEEARIAECIDSVLAQTYPKDRLQVLLVDGGSTDRTRDIVRGYVERHGCIQLLDNPARIAPVALNIGIRAARGTVIVRLDAHARYDAGYVECCVHALTSTGAWAVGGPITTLPGDETPMARAIALATSHRFGVGDSKFRTSREAQYVDTVPFGAFPREVFDAVGVYDEALVRNQDIELCSRIRQHGGKVYLDPAIRSFYYNKATLRGLAAQSFANGRWNVYTNAISGNVLSVRHYVPLVFVSCLVAGAAIALTSGVVFPLATVALPYVVACSYFALRLGLANDPRLIPLLPLAFATTHLSYGAGSLVALLRWRALRRARSARAVGVAESRARGGDMGQVRATYDEQTGQSPSEP